MDPICSSKSSFVWIETPKTYSTKARNLTILSALISTVVITMLASALFVCATVASQTLLIFFSFLLTVFLFYLAVSAAVLNHKAQKLIIETTRPSFADTHTRSVK